MKKKMTWNGIELRHTRKIEKSIKLIIYILIVTEKWL